MKNKIILAITSILLIGCSTDILSSYSISSDGKQKYCYQLYCKAVSKEDIENPKINKPIDLAVSNDGKNVYVLNTRVEADPEGSCGNRSKENSSEIPRGYIYNITEDKKISVLKINGNYEYSCHNRSLIESDKNLTPRQKV